MTPPVGEGFWCGRYRRGVSDRRSTWYDLLPVRLIGHPLVFGLISFGLLVAVTLLVVTLGRGDGLPELLSRLVTLISVAFGALLSWASLRERRRRLNR